MRLEIGCKYTRINEKISLHSENGKQIDSFLDEFRNKTVNDLLTSAFTKHSEFFDFLSSGLIPKRLLSIIIYTNKSPQMPPNQTKRRVLESVGKKRKHNEGEEEEEEGEGDEEEEYEEEMYGY